MKLIELKCVDPFFARLMDLSKPFEIRKNDRDYQAGDVLRLRDYHPVGGYGPSVLYRRILYVMTSDQFPQGLQPGYVAMGLRPVRTNASGFMWQQTPEGWGLFAHLSADGKLEPA